MNASEKATHDAAVYGDGAVDSDALSDKDLALAIVGEKAHYIDPRIEARVVRKIDLFLIPTLFMGMFWTHAVENDVSVSRLGHVLTMHY